MRPAARVVAIALVLLAAPVQAQGEEAAADPLRLAATLHVGSAALVEEAPAEGSAYFSASQPGTAPTPLTFSWAAPEAYQAQADAAVTLRVKSDQPLVARDANGDALEVTLLLGGEPTGDPVVLDFGETLVLQPSDEAHGFAFTLPLQGKTLAAGAELALRVRPLMPAVTADSLKIVLGGEDPSRVALPDLRLPDLAALGVEESASPAYLLGEGPRPSAPYVLARVYHDHVEVDAPPPTGGQQLRVLVLEGREGAADAAAHHEKLRASERRDAAHVFVAGTLLARVVPGTEVHVNLTPSTDGATTQLRCIQHCPADGLDLVLTLRDPTVVNQTGGAGTLVPPPRSTSGIPVSQDAPPEEDKSLLPLPFAAPLAAFVVGAWLLGRRR